jgi:hypothetical protein
MCPGTYIIGYVDPLAAASGNPAAVGGDSPLYVANPGFHLKCEVPETCVFSGGRNEQLTTINTAQSLVPFLQFYGEEGQKVLPDGFKTDTSNMIIDGFVFGDIDHPRVSST